MAVKKNGKFLDVVYEVYSSIRGHEIILVYEGEITHQITKAFTSLAELDMTKVSEENSVQKKVFHVMVECLQNISRHAESMIREGSLYAGRGIFLVSRDQNCYNVLSGNLIDNPKIEKLEELLEHINSLNAEEIKALHKRQMREGSLSDKGGAGLGFIDIVRKTGQKLEYLFTPIDEDSHMFILNVKVPRRN